MSLLHFVVHLGTHASHGNHLDGPNASPQGTGTGTTGTAGTPSLLRTFLGALRAGSTTPDQTGGTADTTRQGKQLVHDATKIRYTPVDAFFGWVVSEIPFHLHHSSIDIEGTTHTPGASQTPDFGTQKGVGTVLFAVGSTLNGNGSSWASPGTTMGSIVVSAKRHIPQPQRPETKETKKRMDELSSEKNE